MSQTDTDDEEERSLLRTVTPYYRGRPDREMNVIGWSVFLGMVIVLVPLLPFIVIVWLLTKLLDAIASGE